MPGVAIGLTLINETSARRNFGAWREIATRQGLYKIVTDRFEHNMRVFDRK
jgi:hypothetical protein